MNHASYVERTAYSLKIAMIRLRSLRTSAILGIFRKRERAYAKARADRSN